MPPRQNSKPIIIDNKADKDLLDQNKKDLADFFSIRSKKTQVSLTLSILALLAFGLMSSTLPFNSKLFQNIYQKPASFAGVNSHNFLYLSADERFIVGKSQKLTLSVNLEQPKTNAFVAKISYDPSQLSISRSESFNPAAVTLTSQKIDPQTGEIYLVGNIDKVELNSGTMPLVQLTITPLKAGPTNLNLIEAALFNKPDYTNLNTETKNLTLEVMPK